jgi:hypothetical protein
VGQAGTWSISAYDPDGTYLYYSINWGDSTEPSASASSATFQHTYSNAGTYTVAITVKDANEATTQSTITVNVQGMPSCSDTENGVSIYVKGTTTGQNINGTQVSQTDYCYDQNTLAEYSCSYNTMGYVVLNYFSCPSGHTCQDGACEAQAQVACFDSDGGLNNLVSGYATGIDGNSGQVVTMNDTCSGQYVIDYYCSNNHVWGGQTMCPANRVCVNGACVLQATNQPPVITSTGGPTSINVNQQGTWTISAYDPDGNTLTYNVIWGDEESRGMQPSSTFVSTATFQHTYVTEGTYTITFSVKDSSDATTQSTLTVNVEQGQVNCYDSDASGGYQNFNVSGYATGIDGNTGQYVEKYDMCSGNFVVDQYCWNNFVWSAYTFCPSGYACSSGACVLQGANQPPVITSTGGPTSINVNQQGTWTISAYDPDGNTLTYNVVWGDEESRGMQPSSTYGSTATFQHTYSQAGTYTIIFSVKDSGQAVTQSTLTVQVTGTASSQCTDSDGGINYRIKGETKPCTNAADCEPKVDYCSSAGTASSDDSYTLTEYYCGGSGRNVVTATTYRCPYGCSDGACKSQLEGNRPPVITSLDGPREIDAGETGTWTVKAYDPDGTHLMYSVNWGDNDRTGEISQAKESTTATFQHTYAREGRYTITFRVTDKDGKTATRSTSVVVGKETPANGKVRVSISALPSQAQVGDKILVSGKVARSSLGNVDDAVQYKVVTRFYESDSRYLAARQGSSTVRFNAADDIVSAVASVISGKAKKSANTSATTATRTTAAQSTAASRIITPVDAAPPIITPDVDAAPPTASVASEAGSIARPISSQERVDYITLGPGESKEVSAYFAAKEAGTSTASIQVYELVSSNKCLETASGSANANCGQQYKLVASASTNVYITEQPPSPPSGNEFTMKLYKGWNMVSIPSTDSAIRMETFVKYCGSQNYAWMLTENGYVKQGTLKAGYGYWIKAGKDCEFGISAETLNANIQPLFAGWNLVGAPGKGVAVSDYIGTCQITSGPWHYTQPFSSSNSPYAYSAKLEPGKAYWVKVPSDCTLSGVPPSSPS